MSTAEVSHTCAWEISATMIEAPHLISRNSMTAMVRLTLLFRQWARFLFDRK